MGEASCGLLTARPSVVYYAMAVTQKLDVGRPYLIETVARIGGDTPSYSRMLMHIAESRGFVEKSERAGRVYYTRVRRMVGGGKYSRYEYILSKMEPGHEYTARELAYLSKDTRIGVGGIMRRAVDEGRVEICGSACCSIYGKGGDRSYLYRIKEGENGS